MRLGADGAQVGGGGRTWLWTGPESWVRSGGRALGLEQGTQEYYLGAPQRPLGLPGPSLVSSVIEALCARIFNSLAFPLSPL